MGDIQRNRTTNLDSVEKCTCTHVRGCICKRCQCNPDDPMHSRFLHTRHKRTQGTYLKAVSQRFPNSLKRITFKPGAPDLAVFLVAYKLIIFQRITHLIGGTKPRGSRGQTAYRVGDVRPTCNRWLQVRHSHAPSCWSLYHPSSCDFVSRCLAIVCLCSRQ
jgi:hypothetical protein